MNRCKCKLGREAGGITKLLKLPFRLDSQYSYVCETCFGVMTGQRKKEAIALCCDCRRIYQLCRFGDATVIGDPLKKAEGHCRYSADGRHEAPELRPGLAISYDLRAPCRCLK